MRVLLDTKTRRKLRQDFSSFSLDLTWRLGAVRESRALLALSCTEKVRIKGKRPPACDMRGGCVGVARVDQVILLLRYHRRGHAQYGRCLLPCPGFPHAPKRGHFGASIPSARQFASFHFFSWKAIRDLNAVRHEVIWQPVRVYVDEQFQRSQRQMRRSIDHRRARRIPASPG